MSFFCKILLKVFDVQINWGERQSNFEKSGLIVCNHLSYLDVIIIAARRPTCFVTSMEVKNDWFLGTLTRASGCLFVERRSRDNLKNEILEITKALENDIFVTIFPEATTTNGEQMLRFRRPLYNSSIESKKRVIPLCLNYLSIAGKKITKKNRDYIFWYNKMAFFPHLWNLLAFDSIEVELSVLEKVEIDEKSDPAFLAEKTHKIISEKYRPCLA